MKKQRLPIKIEKDIRALIAAPFTDNMRTLRKLENLLHYLPTAYDAEYDRQKIVFQDESLRQQVIDFHRGLAQSIRESLKEFLQTQ